jgi:hypothetical protein
LVRTQTPSSSVRTRMASVVGAGSWPAAIFTGQARASAPARSCGSRVE